MRGPHHRTRSTAVSLARRCLSDECHKAKNYQPGKEEASSKVAQAVIELQRALPNARVVYCSATGASDLSNMAYMERLALWGAHSAFPDFDSFTEGVTRRGVGGESS